MSKILLLDMDNLCHRAWHVLKYFSYKGEATGVYFGVLRDILDFQYIHGTENLVFCFDSRTSKRKELVPEYKANRFPSEEKESLYRQRDNLKDSILSEIGFRNIYCFDGYEADDIIATRVDMNARRSNTRTIRDELVIISSDTDLYQCVQEGVSVWSPLTKTTMTASWFRKCFGIDPKQCAMVKAISGCKITGSRSDNLKGVGRVSEGYALKYLKGELKKSSIPRERIERNKELIDRNLQVCTLPLPGLHKMIETHCYEHAVTREKWQVVIDRFALYSLEPKLPAEKASVWLSQQQKEASSTCDD